MDIRFMAFSKGRKTTSAETMDEDIFARMPQNELSNRNLRRYL